jgi:uncharacterized protein YndB with AHSA1/START domain
MELKFTVYAHVACSPREAFEAVADPASLSGYFTTGGAVGRLESGATVQWDFADFPGAFPVEVLEAVADERIVLRWDSPAGGRTEVIFAFEPVDAGARTKVSVTESGWPETDEGLAASYGNCMGWSQMLCAMKCWIERGFNLREGMYV